MKLATYLTKQGENDRLGMITPTYLAMTYANSIQDLQHHMYYLTLGGKLYIAPIPEDQVLHRVLDLGTGTGIWAIDFGMFPLITYNRTVD